MPIDPASAVLAVLLVIVAGVFGWRQLATFRRVVRSPAAAAEDRRFELGQVRRRLFGAGLMVLLAGLLLGSGVFLDGIRAIDASGSESRARDEPPVLTASQRQFVHLYSAYWIVVLMVVFVLLMTAAVDAYATIRYGVERFRQIRSDDRGAADPPPPVAPPPSPPPPVAPPVYRNGQGH